MREYEMISSLALAGLSGIDYVNSNLLAGLGNVCAQDPQKAQQIIAASAKMAVNEISKDNSRGILMSRLDLLSPQVKDGVVKRSKQIIQPFYYSTKEIQGVTTVKIFEDADTAAVGLRNVNNGKLGKEKPMVLHGIQVLVSDDVATIQVANFGLITNAPAMLNGEFEVRIDGKIIVEKTPAHVFDTTGRTDILKGAFYFDNPKVIEDEKPIEVNFFTAANAAVPAGSNKRWMKVVLLGSGVYSF